LGILNYEQKNIIAGFDYFTKALRHDPRHYESHFNLAHLYFEEGDFRLAKLHYEISAIIEPGSASAHFNIGLINAINGDLVAAIIALNRAREFATEEEAIQVDELLNSLEKAKKDKK
jgi:Tfp pilus assembly protein PilF